MRKKKLRLKIRFQQLPISCSLKRSVCTSISLFFFGRALMSPVLVFTTLLGQFSVRSKAQSLPLGNHGITFPACIIYMRIYIYAQLFSNTRQAKWLRRRRNTSSNSSPHRMRQPASTLGGIHSLPSTGEIFERQPRGY
jgi:hypothetical protein